MTYLQHTKKIRGFKNAFLEPILRDVCAGMQDENVRADVDDIDYESSEFKAFAEQSISNGLVSHAEVHEVMKNVFNFTAAIGTFLQMRFPEMDFVLQNLSFLCPTNRKHCSSSNIEAVITKYCNGMVNASVAKQQFSVYRNDDSLDFLLLNCDQQTDKFFATLAQMSEYDQFGLLAIILLCMSPDTVECERGFSSMNLTKDRFANRLTQENLHARLTVFLDNRTLHAFPWQSIHPE